MRGYHNKQEGTQSTTGKRIGGIFYVGSGKRTRVDTETPLHQ